MCLIRDEVIGSESVDLWWATAHLRHIVTEHRVRVVHVGHSIFFFKLASGSLTAVTVGRVTLRPNVMCL